MKVRVLVTVYLDGKCFSSGKSVYSRFVERSIYDFDLKEIYRSLRQLYGDSCIVTYKIEDNAAV